MRIGFDAKRAFLNNTGLGNYSRDTIRILSHFYPNNDYFLFTPKTNNTNRLNLLKEKRNINIKLPEGLLNNSLKSYWRSKNITKDLIKNNIDIYHGLTHEIPINIEKTNIKSIVTIHDLIFMRYPNLFNSIDRKIYEKKWVSSCKRANKIIAISKQTKEDIINFFSIDQNKITVLYQGCNDAFKSKIDEKTKQEVLNKFNLPNKYLLYVGTIEERKNLLTLLKTLNKLENQNLIVIGNGKRYKKKCIKYINNHQLNKRVFFLKNLEIEEIASIYQSAEIMIYPSIFEGFGLPILEALFSKIPVITSKGSCFLETGGNKTRYINPLNSVEIEKAIIEIQEKGHLRKEMIEEGCKHAQRFTDERIAKNIMKIYTDL